MRERVNERASERTTVFKELGYLGPVLQDFVSLACRCRLLEETVYGIKSFSPPHLPLRAAVPLRLCTADPYVPVIDLCIPALRGTGVVVQLVFCVVLCLVVYG